MQRLRSETSASRLDSSVINEISMDDVGIKDFQSENSDAGIMSSRAALSCKGIVILYITSSFTIQTGSDLLDLHHHGFIHTPVPNNKFIAFQVPRQARRPISKSLRKIVFV